MVRYKVRDLVTGVRSSAAPFVFLRLIKLKYENELIEQMLKEAVEREFEQLKEKLKGKTGQQVLAVSQKEECSEMCHGFGPCHAEQTHIETTLHLGILTAEPQQADSGGVTIPTERHAHKGGHLRRRWELTEGGIYVSFSEIANLGVRIREGTRSGHDDFQHGFNIYAGEDAAEYFRRGGIDEEEARIHRKFGEKLPIDRSYAYALKLLGQPVPEDFSRALEADSKKEIEKIINALLSEKEVEANLQKAFELGLHRTPRTETLRRGITADVPEYILGLCERYKIELPK